MTEDGIRVRRADWRDPAERKAIEALRHRVFIEEQAVPPELEWDGCDDRALHLLAETDTGTAVGVARLLPDGHLGRMAVAADRRRQGIGRRLLQAAIEAAREHGLPAIELNAQVHAIPFYESAGFTAHGGVFTDAGIPHRHMTLRID